MNAWPDRLPPAPRSEPADPVEEPPIPARAADLDASMFDTDQIDRVDLDGGADDGMGNLAGDGVAPAGAEDAPAVVPPDVSDAEGGVATASTTDGEPELASSDEVATDPDRRSEPVDPVDPVDPVVSDPERAVDPDADLDDGLGTAIAVPERDAATRGARHRRDRRASTTGLLVMMALLVVAVPILAYLGYRSLDENTRGRVLSGRSQPSDPGYEALLEPTSTALLIVTDRDGGTISLALLSLSGAGGQGGAVVALPLQTRLATPAYGQRTFAEVLAAATPPTAAGVIAKELAVGFSDVIAIDADQLATLMDPIGAIHVENPVEVTSVDGHVFAAGPLDLEPTEVADYLGAQDVDGSMVNRMRRSELVLSAWLTEVYEQRDTPGVVPGEAEVGLGRYVRGLAAGAVDYGTLPVRDAEPIGDEPTFTIDEPLARLLLTNAVPFPLAADGGTRLTVRVLNGTGAEAIPQSIMQRLVFGGAQVTVVGNHTSFDVRITSFTYAVADKGPRVEELAEALGKGNVVHQSEADGGTDVTIVLGADVMDAPPALLTPSDVES